MASCFEPVQHYNAVIMCCFCQTVTDTLLELALQHDVEGTVQGARDILDLPDLTYTAEQVVDEDWVEQIKASYVPVQVSYLSSWECTA